MGCVLGREVSSGLVHNGREEKREGVNHEKKSQNVNVESTETVEVKGAENVTVGDEAVEANEADVTKKDDKAEHEGKPRKEKRRSKPDPRLSNPPKHKHGEQVAAGWPSWLSAHVGEAIDGWLPRRADTFEKIDKIGQGTYSNVYKARDTITGKIVALKKVRFDNLEPESVRFMAREIIILRRLDHPNVIKLEGLVTSRMSCSLYLVFEYMEHDLAGLAASPEIKFTEAQVKCYMHQLLSGLEHCHNRHVLHRDIKGSNLLLDNSGILRIADFGLATIFDPHHKHQMTSRVVTLWYRPPELLLGATDYGAGIDLWSAGCILAELLAGKPIMPGRTEVEQLHKIYKLCGSPSEEYWKKSKLPNATLFKPRDPYRRCIRETFKDFPQSSLPLIDTLLAIDPAERKTATDALQSEKKVRLLLTMAGKYTPWIEALSYPIESMRKNLDWLHVFAFDYYEPGTTNNTSPVAALYDPNSDLNTDYGINAWIKSGFPSQNLVLGLPFFGYVWTLVSQKNNQIGAMGTGPGPKDYSYGTEAGTEAFVSINSILSYNDIKRNVIKYRANNSLYNSTYVMNYVSIGTSWVGFDDVEAVKTKVSYAKERNLGGYVVWQVLYDWNSVLSQAAAAEVKDLQEGAASDQSIGMQKKKKLNQLIIILIPMGCVLMLLLLVFTLWHLKRRKVLKFKERMARNKIGSENNEEKGDEETRTLQVYSFDEMKEATNNFSVENELGKGGYGTVYKGKLRNGKEIAVKRLSETSSQGLEEFENEVILTAKLQHINLVKVVGFCIENEEKMLIYEYMPNKSLDHYIYNQVRRLILNWEKRVQIIEGIIQGLLYLQEYSRLTIIHRDIKASNILLDSQMQPKISDFGMARIFKKDAVEANTNRIVGTMGYIPPEYAIEGRYSTKSDVFSFGVLLLQIISGKKNTCLHGPDEHQLNLLEYAFEMWRDGKGMEFMDQSLDDEIHSCKLLKCMQIALLCVQKNPLDRPTMLEVCSMFKNIENLVMNSPKRPAFSATEEDENQVVNIPNGSSEEIDIDNATITQLVAR